MTGGLASPIWKARLLRAVGRRALQPGSWLLPVFVWLALLGVRCVLVYVRCRVALHRWALRRVLRRMPLGPQPLEPRHAPESPVQP